MAFESQRVAVARARAHDRRLRDAMFLRPIGLALVVLVLVPVLGTDPGPALHGRGLGVSIALGVFVACAALIVARYEPAGVAPRVWFLALLGTTALSATALAWLQPTGTSELGLGLVAYVAASRLSRADGIVLTAVATAAVDAATIERTGRVGVSVSSTTLSIALVYLVSVLSRHAREGRERAELLLAQLEDAQEAQAASAAEAERARIARELHDVLAHSLSGLAIQLEGARLLATREQVSGELDGALERAAVLAREGFAEARRAIGTLRGDPLPGPEALEGIVSRFTETTGIAIDVQIHGEPQPLPPETGVALVRAVQEALTNIARHSAATHGSIVLRYSPEATELVVEDHRDGSALPPALAGVGSGYGLTAMRERASLVGGSVEAVATDDGFRVAVRIPA